MTNGPQVFAYQVQEHLEHIAGICHDWEVPQLAHHLTLVLRDPDNPHMSVIFGKDSLDAVMACIQFLKAQGIPDGLPREEPTP